MLINDLVIEDYADVGLFGIKFYIMGKWVTVAVDDQLADELWVDGSEGPLHQVMVNLMQNAVDAMEAVAHPALALSGRRVGDQALAPEWTDYTQKVQYQGYDVTGLLTAGANALGAPVSAR